jgi:hypothetical protein
MTSEFETLAQRAAKAVHERSAQLIGDGAVEQVKRRSRRPAAGLALSIVVVLTLAVSTAMWLSRGQYERTTLDRPVDARTAWSQWRAVDTAAFEADGVVDIASAVVIDGRVVAVGTDAVNAANGLVRPGVWLSDDGRAWRRVPADAIDDGGRQYAHAALTMTDIVAVNDQLIAVGYANFEPRTEALVWGSDDQGESWQLMPNAISDEGSALQAAAVVGTEVVAVGHAAADPPADVVPATWRLTGRSWNSAQFTPVEAGSLWSVSVLGTHRVAVGVDAESDQTTMLFSTSNGPWQPAQLDIDASADVEITRVGTNRRVGFFAVGSVIDDRTGWRRGIVLESADGERWSRDTKLTAPLDSAGDQQFQDMVITDHGAVVVGQQDGRATVWASSPDGRLEPAFRSGESESVAERVVTHQQGLIAIARITPPDDEERAVIWSASAQ